MLKLLLPKGMILSAIQKKELKNYGCCWSTIMRAYTYEEKDAANIEEYLHQKHVAFTCESIPDIDKGKTVQQKTLDTRIDIITDQIYKDKQLLRTELKAFNDEMVLSDLHTIPSVNDYESEFRFKVHLDLHQRYMQLIAAEKELDNLITSQETQETESFVFNGLSFEEMQNIPPKEWIVDQVFGKGDLGMIFGESGCGKTFVVVDLIVSLCHQQAWAESMTVNRSVNVAYFAGEGFSGLAERFKAATHAKGLDDIPNFTLFNKMPQLFLGSDVGEYQESMIRFIQECKNRDYKPDILIIDTLHTAIIDAEENSAKDVGRILSSCKRAISELGCSVILVHHTTKGGGSERGSGALRGGMDFMLEVRMPENNNQGYHKVLCSKLKDGAAWMNKLFSLSKVTGFKSVCVQWNTLTLDEECNLPNKEEYKSQILQFLRQYPGIRFSVSELSGKFKFSRQYCTKILSELHTERKCFKKTSDPDSPHGSMNPWKYFI
jgi:archaellum biogenesis ATPase FlaH